jgi:glycosyltransferase involved in cell wall biosynthesis
MRICYKILTHNETDSLEKLLDFLFENTKETDHILVCDDFSESLTRKILSKYVIQDKNNLKRYDYFQHKFEGDFSKQHNFANSCVGEEFDYIFSIDADEIPNKWLIENIHEILESNDVDLIWVPRINTVEGITEEHIQKWGWRVNEQGWVNFPDYQGRIYKNNKSIYWKNPVHEVVVGAKTISHFPTEEQFCLYHPKDIEKQEKQNELYSGIDRNKE